MTSKSTSPKIMFIVNSLAGGGAERVVLALLEASRDRIATADVSLVLLDDEKRDYPAPDWLTIHQLDGRLSLMRTMRQLFGLLRRERPDLTISFLVRSNVASAIIAKILGHKAIISERANTSGHFKPGLMGRLSQTSVRLAYPIADKVIAVSQGIADDLATNFGVDAKRIVAIANPVPTERIVPAGQLQPAIDIQGPYAVAVSRLTRSKNLALVLEAFARSGGDLSLVILGQGNEREALEAQARALGIADRVIMPGFVDNPYPIVARAAYYVSGSNAEGFPNGQVEALALGTPVLATNCASGPSEVLADKRREDVHGLFEGDYGMLVPVNDAERLAEGMQAILRPEMQSKYRAAGPQRVAIYSTAHARDRYWHVIDSVLATAR